MRERETERERNKGRERDKGRERETQEERETKQEKLTCFVAYSSARMLYDITRNLVPAEDTGVEYGTVVKCLKHIDKIQC